MLIASRIVVAALLLLPLSCSPDDEATISKEIATKVFCYDLLQAAQGVSGGAFSHINLYEGPPADPDTFHEDADLMRSAGDAETADRIDEFAEKLGSPEGSVEVSISLDPGATPAQIEDVRAELEGMAGVESVSYVSAAEAFEAFRKEFEDEPEVVNQAPKDAFPPMFKVVVASMDDAHSVQEALVDLDAVGPFQSGGTDSAATMIEMAAEFQELCRFGS